MALHEFGTPREKTGFTSEIKKTLFVDLNNTATIRILSNAYLTIFTHYINRATVVCLGENCPICDNNKALIMQNPESFRDEPKYSPRRTVNLVNVLDKTPVRVCPKCDTENVAVGGATGCSKCGELLTAVPTPSNRVKVLSRGVTLFDQLDAINNAVRDTKGEVIGLPKYDITLVVSGTGKNKVITPIAGQVSEVITLPEEEMFDLDKVTIRLEPDEMLDLQRGVSLRDIFSARRAASAEAKEPEIVSKEILDSVASDVDSLFKQQ